MNEIRYRDRTWSFVGAARTPSYRLKQIGKSEDGSAVYAENEDPALPRVVYVPKGEGVHELFRLSGRQ